MRDFPVSPQWPWGLHPTEVNENWREALDLVERELDSGTRYVAVGEVGMDLYWDKTFRGRAAGGVCPSGRLGCEPRLAGDNTLP